jgi:HEAT repeat protein
MKTYLKLVCEIIHSQKDASGEAVLKALYSAYCSQSLNQHTFFQNNYDYLNISNLFCTEEKDNTSIPAVFSEVLNHHFQLIELDIAGQFGQMLQAFLTCYPQYLAILNKNITQNMNIKPYHFPLGNSNLSEVITNGSNAEDLVQTVKLIPLLLDHFTEDQFNAAIDLIIKAFFCDNFLATMVAQEALDEIYMQKPAMDFAHAISLLLEKLQSTEIKVRTASILALDKLAKFSSVNIDNIVPVLVTKLQNEDDETKRYACSALLGIANRSDADIYSIVFALATSSSWSGRVDQDFEQELMSPQPEGKISALFLRREIDFTKIITVLQISMQNESKGKRKSAALVFGLISQRPEINITLIVTALLPDLKHDDECVREACANSLSVICKRADVNLTVIVPVLLAMLEDNNEDVIKAVANALGEISSLSIVDFIPIINNLLVNLQDTSVNKQKAAVYFLGKICENSGFLIDRVVDELITLFDTDIDNEINKAVIVALCEISNRPEAKIMTIVTALVRNIRNVGWIETAMINHFLGEISHLKDVDPLVIVPAFLSILKNDDLDMRESVITALIKLCQRPEVNIKLIVNALIEAAYFDSDFDSDFYLNNVIVDALTVIIDQSKHDLTEMTTYLIEIFPKANWMGRKLITEALAAIVKRPEIDVTLITPVFVAGLSEENYSTRQAAIKGVTEISKRVEVDFYPLLPILLASLQDNDNDVRRSAVNAVSELGTRQNNLQQEVTESIEVETIHEGNSKRKRYDGYGHINYSGRGRRARREQRSQIDDRQLENPAEIIQNQSCVDYAHLIRLLIPMLEDTDEQVQFAVIKALGKIVCEKYHNGIAEIIAVLSLKIEDPKTFVKIRIAEVFVEISKINNCNNVNIISILAAQLDETKVNCSMVKNSIVEAIILIVNDKLNQKDTNYCLYGILLQKLFSPNKNSNSLAIIEIITRICKCSTVNFQIDEHLKTPELVKIGTGYLK